MNEGLEFKTKFQVGEFAYFMHDNIVEYRKIDKIYIEIFDSKEELKPKIYIREKYTFSELYKRNNNENIYFNFPAIKVFRTREELLKSL